MIDVVPVDGKDIAIINSDSVILKDTQSALDLMMAIKQKAGTDRFCINSEAVCDDFFRLKTKLAGEVLQKYENYGVKFAIFGDISKFTKKSIPLQDFIRESNKNCNTFFCADQEEAVKCLAKVGWDLPEYSHRN
ncbi:MAG: DUF4180 domain-containing protein [Clostridia bacterium]|nr:DUF4180 domain-containing protein [Clostridia bacterium]